jgi:hypothetical protein
MGAPCILIVYRSVLVLSLDPIQLGLLPLDLLLIFSDLLILSVVFIFLALELVTDQRTRTQSKPAADRGAHTWASHRSANEAARRCTTKRADASSLLPGCQRPTGTTPKEQCARKKEHGSFARKLVICSHR